jgi:predicted flap endonuclease-1-like 5' DNA nuclease
MNQLLNKLKQRWNDWRNPPRSVHKLEGDIEEITFRTALPVISHGDTPLSKIKGVGPKMASKLQLHDIYTVEQLVRYEPDNLHVVTGIGKNTCETLVRRGLRLIT